MRHGRLASSSTVSVDGRLARRALRRRGALAFMLAALLATVACAAAEEKRACSPGAQEECACGSGERGLQVCAGDGSRFGACEQCGGGGAGADGGAGVSAGAGTGGASAAGGTAGESGAAASGGTAGTGGGAGDGGGVGAGGAAGAAGDGGAGGVVHPSCLDGKKDGEETDSDCGGPLCPGCGDGLACIQAGDCRNGVCVGLVCKRAECNDVVANGDESDVDCGGKCTPCDDGQRCNQPSDCAGGHCWLDRCSACPYRTIPAENAAGTVSFCIDQLEVHASGYAQFLSTNPTTSSQGAACSWNTTFQPDDQGACAGSFDPATKADYPVRCVDWCDAQAYCAWKGKRLCGKIGGGAADFFDFNVASQSQWYSACSAGGTRAFPWGNDWSAANCVDQASQPGPVKQYTSCQGGSPELYDMAGNVSEWEDSCDSIVADGGAQDPANDPCRHRGGGYDIHTSVQACDLPSTTPRDTLDPRIGFRCCLD